MQRCYRLQLENWTIRLPGGVPNLSSTSVFRTSIDPFHPQQRYNGDNIRDLCSYHRDGHARTAVSMVEVGASKPRLVRLSNAINNDKQYLHYHSNKVNG